MLQAEQVEVEEILEDGMIQYCPAIQIGNYVIFADNGDTVELPAKHIKIIKRLPWIDISDAIVGN